MGNKIYCGNGKEKQFQNGGSLIEVMLDVDTLAKNFDAYGFRTQAGKRKIRVKVCQSREVDQYGNTHYVEVDTWKPSQQASQPQQAQLQQGPPQGPPQGQGYQNTQPAAPPSGNPGGQSNPDIPGNGAQGNQSAFDDDIPF
ncbi:MAG: hypothetical protein DRZ90_14335 [Spirochaetes bacterium]|nr:MAG: hypothetical protein DRZ90_14335 [Spirochaetota bacterium]